MCDQMWDVTDARVVCRQLGLTPTGILLEECSMKNIVYYHVNAGAEAFTQAIYGEGTGTIWLDNVQCTGSERSLINCTASSSGNNSCTHAQDAGVRCQFSGKYS